MTDRRRVWEPFVEGLTGFVARRVPDADADDVVQDVLLRLHEAASTLRDDDRAEAWVYAIARRTIADFYRRRDDRTVGLDDEPTAPLDAHVVHAAEHVAPYRGDHDVHEEVLSWMRPMAEELPDAYSRALIMADFEGCTQQDVADELGLSLSGAKSRVQRARKMLGEAVRDCCEVEFGPDARATAFRRRDPCDC